MPIWTIIINNFVTPNITPQKGQKHKGKGNVLNTINLQIMRAVSAKALIICLVILLLPLQGIISYSTIPWALPWAWGFGVYSPI